MEDVEYSCFCCGVPVPFLLDSESLEWERDSPMESEWDGVDFFLINFVINGSSEVKSPTPLTCGPSYHTLFISPLSLTSPLPLLLLLPPPFASGESGDGVQEEVLAKLNL